MLERYRQMGDSHSNHEGFGALWWDHSFLCGLQLRPQLGSGEKIMLCCEPVKINDDVLMWLL